MPPSKNQRILLLLNHRLKVTINDGRMYIGQMLAFDKHMNLVLGDCQEFRRVRHKGAGDKDTEEKRVLGLVILRGDLVVSVSVEAPPPMRSEGARLAAHGIARPAGRGMPVVPAMAGGSGGATFQPQPPMMPPMMPQGGFRPPPMGMPPMMPHGGFRPPPGMPMLPPGFRPPMPQGFQMPPPGFRPPQPPPSQ